MSDQQVESECNHLWEFDEEAEYDWSIEDIKLRRRVAELVISVKCEICGETRIEHWTKSRLLTIDQFLLEMRNELKASKLFSEPFIESVTSKEFMEAMEKEKNAERTKGKQIHGNGESETPRK